MTFEDWCEKYKNIINGPDMGLEEQMWRDAFEAGYATAIEDNENEKES